MTFRVTRKVSRTYKNNVNQYQSSLIRLLILSGDIALNPGPVKYHIYISLFSSPNDIGTEKT